MRIASLLLTLFVIAGCQKEGPADEAPEAQTSAEEEATGADAASAESAEEAETPDDEGSASVDVIPLQHGSLMLRSGDITIAVDPVAAALEAAGAEEPKADLVLITHQHGDHLDPATIAKVRKEGAPVVVPARVAEEAGDALTEPTIMANGETNTFLDAVEVEAVPMYNLERKRENGEFYHPKGMGNGYVVTFAGKRIYLSGDTECIPEMKSLEKIDMAFVCMNLPYTMTPEEAAVCIREFKPKKLYPYHFRGQDPGELQTLLSDVDDVEIVQLDWYPDSE